MAAATLSQSEVTPVNGLHSMNPYVSSTLAEWPGKGLRAAVPRQLRSGCQIRHSRCIGRYRALSPDAVS
jgi:hypothetical protein